MESYKAFSLSHLLATVSTYIIRLINTTSELMKLQILITWLFSFVLLRLNIQKRYTRRRKIKN